MIITTNKLIQSVKKRGLTPSSQVALTDEDLIRFANEELQQNLFPFMVRYGGAGDEYMVVEETYKVTAGNTITVPSRAYAGKLRDVFYVMDKRIYQIPKIQREDQFNFQQVTQYPLGYYLRGNKIVFLPTNLNYSGDIHIAYFMRPSDLVMESNARKIVSIDTSINSIILNAINPSWVEGDKIDITSSGYDCTISMWDATIVAINSGTNEVVIDLSVSELNEGDVVTLANTSSIPQIPSELHPLLVARTLCAVQKALKDSGANATLQTINEMEDRLKDILTDRTIGQSDKLVNRNSVMRTNRAKWSRWTSSVL
jgi:hypothetical protein